MVAKKIEDKYLGILDYVQKVILPLKDKVFEKQDDVFKAEKELMVSKVYKNFQSQKNRLHLLKVRLDQKYSGLERFRK